MNRRAFTYYEVLLALLLLAIAAGAIVGVFGAGSGATRQIEQLAHAVHLANSVHEFAMSKQLVKGPTGSYATTQPAPAQFTNVCNLDGWSSGTAGPIDSAGNRMAGAVGWVQTCRVQAFDVSDPTVLFAPSDSRTTDTNARKLSVTISYNGAPIYKCSWILAPTVN